jgi:hypothetical protein
MWGLGFSEQTPLAKSVRVSVLLRQTSLSNKGLLLLLLLSCAMDSHKGGGERQRKKDRLVPCSCPACVLCLQQPIGQAVPQ